MTLTWRFLTCLFLGTASIGAAAQSDGPQAHRPDPTERQLRLARSTGGAGFADAGLFLDRAGSPEIVTLSGDRLLALFDYAPGESSSRTVIGRSLSVDGGRTWSHPEPVRFEGAQRLPFFSPALLVGPSDVLRLYVVSVRDDAGADNAAAPAARAAVWSAVSRDGQTFTLEPHAAFEIAMPQNKNGGPSAHAATATIGLTAAVFDRRAHLFVSLPDVDSPRGAPGETGATLHYTSTDGRRFDDRPQGVRSDVTLRGSLLSGRQGLIAYVSDGNRIVTASSRDARTWMESAGAVLEGGTDPAVAQLASGAAVMLYVASDARRSADEHPSVVADARGSRAILDAFARAAAQSARRSESGAPDATGGVFQPELADAARPAGNQDGSSAEPPGGREIVVLGESGAVPSATGNAGGDVASGPAGSHRDDSHTAMARSDGSATTAADPAPAPFLMAPRPTFKERVDYVAWHQSQLRVPADNAYYAYAAFMPDARHPETSPPPWPEGVNMFSDPNYTEPQGPWRPEDHPDWDATHQRCADLRDQYRQASLVSDYIQPPLYDDSAVQSPDDGRPLLMEMLLPNLRHHRTMAKELIADAWRVGEDGQVSAEKMLDAWRTTLRGASHLNGSVTLIEHLVALAEQGLVHQAARQALVHGVFNDQELEAALDTLMEFDRADYDSSRLLQGEFACAMDTIQYMFTPADEDGRPRLNPERANKVLDWTGDEQIGETLKALQPEDAWAAMDAFDAHYRELAGLMETGYPEVRAADMAAFEEASVEKTALQRLLTPSLSRIHTMRARNEATRRATQLSYALHLFKAAHGRWPDSLDELPVEHGRRMRTDPFTGLDFGYRLDASGPTLYSLSENGLDDGGVHASRWGDRPEEEGPGDDYVFWPPQGS